MSKEKDEEYIPVEDVSMPVKKYYKPGLGERISDLREKLKVRKASMRLKSKESMEQRTESLNRRAAFLRAKTGYVSARNRLLSNRLGFLKVFRGSTSRVAPRRTRLKRSFKRLRRQPRRTRPKRSPRREGKLWFE